MLSLPKARVQSLVRELRSHTHTHTHTHTHKVHWWSGAFSRVELQGSPSTLACEGLRSTLNIVPHSPPPLPVPCAGSVTLYSKDKTLWQVEERPQKKRKKFYILEPLKVLFFCFLNQRPCVFILHLSSPNCTAGQAGELIRKQVLQPHPRSTKSACAFLRFLGNSSTCRGLRSSHLDVFYPIW